MEEVIVPAVEKRKVFSYADLFKSARETGPSDLSA
jgi:hypothetical protein